MQPNPLYPARKHSAVGVPAFEKDDDRRPVLRILEESRFDAFPYVSLATGVQHGAHTRSLQKFVEGVFKEGDDAAAAKFGLVLKRVRTFAHDWMKRAAACDEGTTRTCAFWVRILDPEPAGPYVAARQWLNMKQTSARIRARALTHNPVVQDDRDHLMRVLDVQYSKKELASLQELMDKPVPVDPPDQERRGSRERDPDVSKKNQAAQAKVSLPLDKKKKQGRKSSKKAARAGTSHPDLTADSSRTITADVNTSRGRCEGAEGPAGPSTAPAEDDADDCVIMSAGPEDPKLPDWVEKDDSISEDTRRMIRDFGRTVNQGCSASGDGGTQRHLGVRTMQMVESVRTIVRAMGGMVKRDWSDDEILQFIGAQAPPCRSKAQLAPLQSPSTVSGIQTTAQVPPQAATMQATARDKRAARRGASSRAASQPTPSAVRHPPALTQSHPAATQLTQAAPQPPSQVVPDTPSTIHTSPAGAHQPPPATLHPVVPPQQLQAEDQERPAPPPFWQDPQIPRRSAVAAGTEVIAPHSKVALPAGAKRASETEALDWFGALTPPDSLQAPVTNRDTPTVAQDSPARSARVGTRSATKQKSLAAQASPSGRQAATPARPGTRSASRCTPSAAKQPPSTTQLSGPTGMQTLPVGPEQLVRTGVLGTVPSSVARDHMPDPSPTQWGLPAQATQRGPPDRSTYGPPPPALPENPSGSPSLFGQGGCTGGASRISPCDPGIVGSPPWSPLMGRLSLKDRDDHPKRPPTSRRVGFEDHEDPSPARASQSAATVSAPGGAVPPLVDSHGEEPAQGVGTVPSATGLQDCARDDSLELSSLGAHSPDGGKLALQELRVQLLGPGASAGVRAAGTPSRERGLQACVPGPGACAAGDLDGMAASATAAMPSAPRGQVGAEAEGMRGQGDQPAKGSGVPVGGAGKGGERAPRQRVASGSTGRKRGMGGMSMAMEASAKRLRVDQSAPGERRPPSGAATRGTTRVTTRGETARGGEATPDVQARGKGAEEDAALRAESPEAAGYQPRMFRQAPAHGPQGEYRMVEGYASPQYVAPGEPPETRCEQASEHTRDSSEASSAVSTGDPTDDLAQGGGCEDDNEDDETGPRGTDPEYGGPQQTQKPVARQRFTTLVQFTKAKDGDGLFKLAPK